MSLLTLKLLWVGGAALFLVAVLVAAGAPEGVNYIGIAAVIGALGAFLTIVGNFVMSLLTFMQNRELMVVTKNQNSKIEQVHVLVNSQSEELKAALTKVSFAEGKDAGVAAEQARVEGAPPSVVRP